jgi:glycosyltransferase involved in cell wall biosynthesis
MRLFMLPSPRTPDMMPGGVGRVAFDYIKGLTALGFEFVRDEQSADAIALHALARSVHQVNVFHCHGLYPTATPGFNQESYYRANNAVVQNALHAQVVTCVSEWSADILRRDLALSPQVVRNGIWMDEYRPAGKSTGPVLWPKAIVSPTCDPDALIGLSYGNSDLPFISLAKFANPSPNVKVLSYMLHDEFLRLLGGCSVLLGTTRENGSITIMEAMALGVPVVGYDIGANHETLNSGTGCELVPFGDVQALDAMLHKVLGNWAYYSKQARQYAEVNFDWHESMELLTNIYHGLGPTRYKISIVIPSHNYARFLPQAIDSAINQTLPCEIIVVDDASTDDSLSVAQGYADKIRLIHFDENKGVAAARNAGIEAASGDLIVCLDADDVIEPDYLATLLPAFNDRSCGIAFTPVRVMAEDGQFSRTSWFTNEFIYFDQAQGHNCVPSCCMFRKSLWRRAGGYRQVYSPAEDAELWLRITALGYTAQLCGKHCKMHYRKHDAQASSSGFPNWWVDKPYRLTSPALSSSYKVQNYDQPQVTFVVNLKTLDEAPQVLLTLDSLFSLPARDWMAIVIYDAINLVYSQVIKALPLNQVYPYVDLRRSTEVLAVLSPTVIHLAPGETLTRQDYDQRLALTTRYFPGGAFPSSVYWTISRGLLDACHA